MTIKHDEFEPLFKNAVLRMPLCSGAGVKIAILDSGLNLDFPLISSRRCRVFDCRRKDPMGVSLLPLPWGETSDTNGHGSVVQSCLYSVAPDVEVDHYRILDQHNQCDGHLLCDVLESVVDEDYDVIHLSLGTKLDRYVPRLVNVMRRAYESNKVLVAAAVHQGHILYPAKFTSTFSCDAHAVPNPLLVKFRESNVIEFEAWGVQVTVPGPKNKSYVVSGSSYAAAHLSGIVARAHEALGNKTTALELKILLKEYAYFCAEGF